MPEMTPLWYFVLASVAVGIGALGALGAFLFLHVKKVTLVHNDEAALVIGNDLKVRIKLMAADIASHEKISSDAMLEKVMVLFSATEEGEALRDSAGAAINAHYNRTLH